MLLTLFTSSLRSIVPPEFHSTYLISSDNVDYIKEAIALENKYVGFVYLLDWTQRIRWAGCGFAWGSRGQPITQGETSELSSKDQLDGYGFVDGPGEADRLEVCTQVLLDRLEKHKKSEAKLRP